MSDLKIAQEAKLEKIENIASALKLDIDDIELYGKYKAKINLDAKIKEPKNGKVILVTAINPTPAGEGKSTTTIGLADALNMLGHKSIVTLREPSLGPVMGIKGGATGGGYAQVLPMEDINLHFTGDIHAITSANNLISAVIDNHIHQGNELRIDPNKITWCRTLDLNDRALRNVTVGLGGKQNGISRDDSFSITVASEIMAILCLASSLDDLKERVGKAVFGYNLDNEPLNIDSLGIKGAVALLLKDAIKPNLVQTIYQTPALIHGGPFANIAHGCNSLIATKMAMSLADYVVTEAGFGADLGAEKFLNIKTRAGFFNPSCVVVVGTIRALKMHGGVLKKNLDLENIEALKRGLSNMEKHIENIKSFNIPYVIAVNKFMGDSPSEIEALVSWAKENDHSYSISEAWEKGPNGALDLARAVVEKVNANNELKYTYSLTDSIEEKITKIATKIYGARDVSFSPKALNQLQEFKNFGWDKLPICMAKTPYSLSDNPKLIGRPSDFIVQIKELKPAIGAGFIIALSGDIMTMPGLPKVPSACGMDVIENQAKGLF